MKRIQDLRIIRHPCIYAVRTITTLTLKKIPHLTNNIQSFRKKLFHKFKILILTVKKTKISQTLYNKNN